VIQVTEVTYPFYRVGRRYFTRLSEARKMAKATANAVERFDPAASRRGEEKVWVVVE
jgi:hypothetical protein